MNEATLEDLILPLNNDDDEEGGDRPVISSLDLD